METRYHMLHKDHWEHAKKHGGLDSKYAEDGYIWSSKHPESHYRKEFGNKTPVSPHHVDLAITLPKNRFRTPPGGGTSDRITRGKIALKHIKVVEGE